MLSELLRTDDVADLRQSTLSSRLVKGIKAGVRVTLVAQGRTILGSLVLLKVGEHVVFKVVKVLPHLPGDAGILEVLGEGLPDKGEAVDLGLLAPGSGGVVEDRAALTVGVGGRAGDVDGTAHPDDAVGVGRTQDGLARHVHDGPALSNVKVRRDVVTRKVAHAVRRVASNPLVTLAAVVSCVHGAPAVATAAGALGPVGPVAAFIVEMPGFENVDAILRGANGSAQVSWTEMTLTLTLTLILINDNAE